MESPHTLINKKATLQKKTKEKPFTVVAIGASAGGLEAVSILLKKLPADTGMAYIYVQHLSPDHKSLLTSILSKITKMKVQEIDNMEKMEPNNVYVIPPNKVIEVINGHIQLLPRLKKNIQNLTIDVLFSSLAETHKANTIGIVLSGYASDGMIGLKAIKDAGGITFAQDDTAQASSMPNSAIAAGAVDYILSPEEIAEELVRLSQNDFVLQAVKEKETEIVVVNNKFDLNTIFELLLKETGVDFSHYKMPTIKRRINHKMQQSGVKTIKEYVKLLLKKNNEINLLYTDLLINVTSFFREKEALQYFKTSILPKLLKSKTAEETLRIWVPACSTGQEAYSIAMIISELQENNKIKIPVQIFATDLSEKVIREARVGEYSQNDIKSVPEKYLKRYFTKMGDTYCIVKELREMCVFAPHNVLRDPPFSRMDFISCCNLLIYFDAAAQKKVFTTLHFALKDSGYLMLAKAESVGASSPLFTQINNEHKIYSRKNNLGIRKIPELTPRFTRSNMSVKKPSLTSRNSNVNPVGIEDVIDAVLLSSYMPACAVVNKDMEILQFRGPVASYLEHPSGKASLNILKMARPEFAFELRNAINTVIKTKKPVTKSGIEIEIDSVLRMMSFEVCPLKIEWDEPLLLIVFKPQEQIEKFIENDESGKNNSKLKDIKIKKLTDELNKTRAEMTAIIESQESTYEELQAANEEIVSSNEEFQSLNEELETSKEEIEATNEELITTNQELQMRNELITESHEYSEAIIATIHEPMLVLNKNFQVISANKSFYKKFLVDKEETEGKLFFDLGNKQWNIPKLREVLNNIISKNSGFENFEVTQTFSEIGEKIMLLNAHLIVQKANSEQLILLAIEDITDRSLYYLKEKYSLSLIEASLDPLITINMEGKITDMNQATVKITGISREKLKGSDFFNYFTQPQKAREVYQEVFLKGSVANSPLTLRHKNGKLTEVLFNGSVYKDDRGNVLGAVIVARDISEQIKFEESLKKSLKEISDYKYALDESSIVAITDQKGIINYVNDNFCKISQFSREELIGNDHSMINSSYHPKEFIHELYETIAKGKIWRGELKNKAKNGTIYWLDTTIVPFLNENGKPYQYVAVRSDITERKKIETEFMEAKVFAELATLIAEEAQSKAEQAVKAKQQFLSNMSHEIRTPMNAIIGFTKVLFKTDLSEKQKEYLNAIKMSGDALIVLINDILDLAKVDAGKMDFEQIHFKMETSLTSMLHLFETKILEKNLKLFKHYDKKIPDVLIGDPVRLNQIILNLLSNAVKFTLNGKITVDVHLLQEDDEKVIIEFTITDTGIGIEENKIKTIFENFQQASTGTSRMFGGTGLGLAIVKKLVEAQGGTIRVKSKIDEGSAFSFTLPFIKSKEEIDPDNNQEKTEHDYSEIRNIKVLVVEDMALNQLLMKTILDDFGFERDVADNGKIALEKLEDKAYDIILMDLQMPVMNGFEATSYIRKNLHSTIPIIALTADVTTMDLEKCRAAGMDDYISKPVDERLLYRKIVSLVKKPEPIVIGIEFNDKEKDLENNTESEKIKYTDLTFLNERTKSNPKLMMEMISIYLLQTPLLVSSMKQFQEDKNWDLLQKTVHKMIPSFSIMGMSPAFENMAKKIQEYASKEQHTDEIADLVIKLEMVCAQACKELEEELNTIKKTEL
jgi:two-component system CheB/CheR fusion protein